MTNARLQALLDKAHHEKRSRILGVRLTPGEYAAVRAYARKEKVPVAVMARLLILAGLEHPGV